MGTKKRMNITQRQKEGKQPLLGSHCVFIYWESCTMLGRSVIYYLLYLDMKYALRRYMV